MAPQSAVGLKSDAATRVVDPGLGKVKEERNTLRLVGMPVTHQETPASWMTYDLGPQASGLQLELRACKLVLEL